MPFIFFVEYMSSPVRHPCDKKFLFLSFSVMSKIKKARIVSKSTKKITKILTLILTALTLSSIISLKGGIYKVIHLKAARVNAGMTQEDVREFLLKNGYNTAISTISNWESEKTFPPVNIFKLLCRRYGLKMDDIFIPETLTYPKR